MSKSTKELIITLIIGLLIVLFILKKCSLDNESRETLRRTTKICDSVFVETYLIFGQGAFGTDLVSDWLTDNKNFRIYIGTYDEGRDGYWYKCQRDSIFARKKFIDNETGIFIRDSLVFADKILDLKKRQNFDED